MSALFDSLQTVYVALGKKSELGEPSTGPAWSGNPQGRRDEEMLELMDTRETHPRTWCERG